MFWCTGGGGGGGETDRACVGSEGPIISTRHGCGGAKLVRWGEAVHWSFLFIYFIHLIIFTQGEPFKESIIFQSTVQMY